MAIGTQKQSAFSALSSLNNMETPKKKDVEPENRTATPIPEEIIEKENTLIKPEKEASPAPKKEIKAEKEPKKDIKEEPVKPTEKAPEPVKEPVIEPIKPAVPVAEPVKPTITAEVKPIEKRGPGKPKTRSEGDRKVSFWLDEDVVDGVFSVLKYGESAAARINDLIRKGLAYEKQ